VFAMGLLVFYFHRRLPIGRIFSITSWILLALAVVFVGRGIREFQEVGFIPVHFLDFIPHVNILGIYPTVESIAAQIFVLSITLYLMGQRMRLPAG